MTSPRTRSRLIGAAALIGVAALTAATMSPLSATADDRADRPSDRLPPTAPLAASTTT